jgi:surface antigen
MRHVPLTARTATTAVDAAAAAPWAPLRRVLRPWLRRTEPTSSPLGDRRRRWRVPATTVIALSVLGIQGLPAQATTQWPPSCSSSGYSCDDTGYQGQSTWGFPGGHNCTNYVAWRLQHDGVGRPAGTPTSLGNAMDWKANAAKLGVPVNTTPTVGAVAWWDADQGYLPGWKASDVGHVAYVKQVKSSTDIVIVEDNYPNGPLDVREVWAGDTIWPGAFIHFSNSSSPAPPPRASHWGIVEANANIRSGPGTGYSTLNVAANQQSVTVWCYATGTVISGNPYWDYLTDPANATTGYIADALVYTGGDITTQLPHC